VGSDFVARRFTPHPPAELVQKIVIDGRQRQFFPVQSLYETLHPNSI
jgi:hypothetical protein